MAGVHCEICGGNLVAASRSTMFICEHCGISYPKNKVRRMLFKDAGVDSNAPISSEEMSHLRELVKKYFREENFIDAENVTKRILSADGDDEVGNYYFDILCKMKKEFRIERRRLIKYVGKDTTVRIPKTTLAIAGSAFQDNKEVEKIIIPEGVISIEHDAFNGCTSLKHIELPSTLSFIGYRCFSQCESLVEVKLPDKVKFLGDFAFCGCSSLEKINIPPKLTTIGRNTFANCSELKDFTLGPSVTSIGCGAFKECRSLGNIGDISKILFIGENAFKGCDNLVKPRIEKDRFMSNGWEKYARENKLN
ncbi:MAG: leucine-rich repeat domain-containing protein [Bacillota bacterium]|nr:leucine-rich repeat domain-containing protein [Bacillota bacterium]